MTTGEGIAWAGAFFMAVGLLAGLYGLSLGPEALERQGDRVVAVAAGCGFGGLLLVFFGLALN